MENEYEQAYGIWATDPLTGKQVIVTMGRTKHQFELAEYNFPTSDEESRVWAAGELGVEDPSTLTMCCGLVPPELVEAAV